MTTPCRLKPGLHALCALALAFIAANTVLAASAPSGDVTAAATQFVDMVAKENFAGAVTGFDATMKGALPQAKLEEIWQTLKTQAGPYKKRLGTRVEKLGGYDIVFVTCQFEQTALDTKVVFDSKRQIAGLFFVPTRPPVDFSVPPLYARTNTFRESNFTVGSGEWRLPGTLTVPIPNSDVPAPAVVLVHGSGPNDRDETIGVNKPFRDLAWGLATKGIAVLRYEKRTKEHGARISQGDASKLTVKEEIIDDALSAVAQLRTTDGIDPKRIFVLGHSLGGGVAPRIGQADPQIAGLIIMAGTTRPLEDLMVEQTRYLLSLEGKMSAEGEAKLAEIESATAKVKKLTAADASSSKLLLGAPPIYWLDLRDHDPAAVARSLKQRLLILQGARDYQATEADFEGWKKALSSRPTATLKMYPDLNHLFMTGKGKSTPAEYEQAGHVAEGVVTDIAAWIKGGLHE